MRDWDYIKSSIKEPVEDERNIFKKVIDKIFNQEEEPEKNTIWSGYGRDWNSIRRGDFTPPSITQKLQIETFKQRQLEHVNSKSTPKTFSAEKGQIGSLKQYSVDSDKEGGFDSFTTGFLSKLPITGLLISEEDKKEYSDVAKILAEGHSRTLQPRGISGTRTSSGRTVGDIQRKDSGIGVEVDAKDFSTYNLGEFVGEGVKWYAASKLAGFVTSPLSLTTTVKTGAVPFDVASPIVNKLGRIPAAALKEGAFLATFSTVLGLSESMTIDERLREATNSFVFGAIFGAGKEGIRAFKDFRLGIYKNTKFEGQTQYFSSDDVKDLKTLRSKYKKLAFELHPDKGGSTEAIQNLNNQFEYFEEQLLRKLSNNPVAQEQIVKQLEGVVGKAKPASKEVETAIKVYNEAQKSNPSTVGDFLAKTYETGKKVGDELVSPTIDRISSGLAGGDKRDWSKIIPKKEEVVTTEPQQAVAGTSDAKDIGGVLYHGTESDFEEFEISGKRMTSLGQGYYFTPTVDKAKQYGSKIKTVRLKTDNVLDWGNLTGEDRKKIIEVLNPIVPENEIAGYGTKQSKIFAREDKEEAMEFYDEMVEKTKDYTHDRAKASVKLTKNRDFEIVWMEPSLEGASNEDLLALAQRYDNNIGNALGYDAVKYGDEVVVFDNKNIEIVNQDINNKQIDSEKTKKTNYKAMVTNDEGKIEFIEKEYDKKTDFIKDLRANGYKVNNYNVKEAEVFDYISSETNMTPDDFKNINTKKDLEEIKNKGLTQFHHDKTIKKVDKTLKKIDSLKRSKAFESVVGDKGKVKIYHYSDKEITKTSPDYYGTSINAGEELKTEMQDGKMVEGFEKKTNFYTESSILEPRFRNMKKYEAEVDANDLYDFISNPSKFKTQTEVKEAGYKGYVVSGPNSDIQVRMFEDVAVKKTTEKALVESYKPGTKENLYARVAQNIVSGTKSGNTVYSKGINASILSKPETAYGFANTKEVELNAKEIFNYIQENSYFLEDPHSYIVYKDGKIGITYSTSDYDVGKAAEKMVAGIKAYGGASVKGLTTYSPSKGYMISIRGTEADAGEFNVENAKKFIENNKDKLQKTGVYAGAWSDNGRLYIELSKNVLSKEKAINEATKEMELAIFDVENTEEIFTGWTSMEQEYARANDITPKKAEIEIAKKRLNEMSYYEDGRFKTDIKENIFLEDDDPRKYLSDATNDMKKELELYESKPGLFNGDKVIRLLKKRRDVGGDFQVVEDGVPYDIEKLIKDAEDFYKKSVDIQEGYVKSMIEVGKATGAKPYIGPPKSINSTVKKNQRKLRDEGKVGYTPKDMKDNVRSIMILKDLQQVKDVINLLDKNHKIINSESFLADPLNETGYRGIHLAIDLGDDITGEIQLHTEKMFEAKLKGDELYEKWRGITPTSEKDIAAKEADLAKVNKMFEEAISEYAIEMLEEISDTVAIHDHILFKNVIAKESQMSAELSKKINKLPLDLQLFAKEKLALFKKNLASLKKSGQMGEEAKGLYKTLKKWVEADIPELEKLIKSDISAKEKAIAKQKLAVTEAKAKERAARLNQIEVVRQEKIEAVSRTKEKEKALSSKKIEQMKEEKTEALAKEKAKGAERIEKLKEHTAEVVESKRARAKRRAVENELQSTLKKLNSKKAKMRPVYEKAANEILEQINAKTKSITKGKKLSLEKSRAFFETQKEIDPSYEVPEYLRDELTRLDKKNISELTDEEILTLTDVANHIIKTNDFVNKLITKRGAKEIKEVVDEAVTNIQKRPSYKNVKESKNFEMETKGRNTLQKVSGTLFGEKALDPERLAKKILSHNTDIEAYKILYPDMSDAQSKKMELYYKYLDGVYKELSGNKLVPGDKKYTSSLRTSIEKIKKDMSKVELVSINGEDMSMKKSQYIDMYIQLTTPYNAEQIVNGKGISFETKPGQAIELDVANALKIVKEFPEDYVEQAEIIRSFYNMEEIKSEINKTTVEDLGYNVIKNDGVYYPANRASEFRNKNIDGSVVKTVRNPGWIKFRTGGKEPIVIMNALERLENHVNEMSDYIAYNSALRNYKSLMQNRDFINAVSKEDYNELLGLYKQINGNKRPDTAIEKGIKNIQTKVSHSILALNLDVMSYQPLSLMYAAPEFSKDVFWKGMASASLPSNELMYKYSPIIRYRGEGHITRESGEVLEKGKRAGTAGITKMDMLAVRKIWKMSELQIEKEGFKPGTDAFYEAVARKAEEVIFRTQPNYTTMQRSGISRSTSATERLLTAFSTQTNKMYNNMYEVIDNYRVNKDKKSFDKMMDVFIYTMIGQAALAGVKTTSKKSRGLETTFWKEMLSSVTAPFYGVKDLVSLVTSDFYYKPGGLVIDSIVDFVESLYDMSADTIYFLTEGESGKKSSKTYVGHVQDVLEKSLKFTGAPLYNIDKEVKRILYTIDPMIEYSYNNIFYDSRTKKNDLYKIIVEQNKRYDTINPMMELAIDEFKRENGSLGYILDYAEKDNVSKSVIDKIRKNY